MVNLPPDIEELNTYARFVFLHEMHLIAIQILVAVEEEFVNYQLMKLAVQAIECERNLIQNYFTVGYVKPQDESVLALIQRCAEIYLSNGIGINWQKQKFFVFLENQI